MMSWMSLGIIFMIHTRCSSRLCMSTKEEFKESFIVVPLGILSVTFNRAIHYEEVQSHLCHIRIEINYQYSELKILLTNQFDHQVLNDAQIYFRTELFSINDKNITIINTIESACSEDQCEREIFQHHSQWLIKIDYYDLQMNLKSWIERKDNKSGEEYLFFFFFLIFASFTCRSFI